LREDNHAPRTQGHRQGGGAVCEDLPMQRSAGSELLSMMGLVAAVVAIVILVFFGVGYLFGRLFL
jgi:type IV secretory pathway VirB2 component (pilin)